MIECYLELVLDVKFHVDPPDHATGIKHERIIVESVNLGDIDITSGLTESDIGRLIMQFKSERNEAKYCQYHDL